MRKKNQVKKSAKMTSFQLFRDKNAKDWKEGLREIGDFLEKNKQWILIFLLGLATFPILFFLSVSLKEATTGLIRKTTTLSLTVRSSTFLTPIPTKKPVVSPIPTVNISPAEKRNIIGGDRDEHGCYTSAGYSWCESKNKCLRTWEESCPE